jgi:5-methylcytosine-specific restriction enzyme A
MPTKPPIFRSPFQPIRPVENRGTSAERGYDAAWRRFRFGYLAAHPICVFIDHPYARQDCQTAATIVDHITPLADGGARLDEHNCRSVCVNCHAKLTTNYKLTGRNEMPPAIGGRLQ